MTEIIKKVGPYRLTKRIGSGATSEVFEAFKEGDHQKYAIKMIRLKSITEGQKQMIKKEIFLIKSISHPHIVKLYDHLQTPNNFYLVFQYCQKGDLQNYLKKYFGPLIPQDAAQKIFFCIGDAVKEIHSKGIVHRDIKLANILLKKDLTIKLADFGFAKQINEEQFMMKTFCGTPITMAPQILLNKLYDRKCDIWSLGVIMFQLIYGKLPFAINQGYNKFVQRVVKQQLKIPSQPQMPQQFKELLAKCLQKNPQKRYSIEEFMSSEWILKGKQKKLEERKMQNEAEVTQLLNNISHEIKNKQSEDDEDDLQAKKEQRQRKSIIEFNTAQKLYNFLKNELQKIVQNYSQNREQISEKIESILTDKNQQKSVKDQYEKLFKLLIFLDYKYLNFLNDLKIKIYKDTAETFLKLQDINNFSLPDFLYRLKNKNQKQQKPIPQSTPFGQTINNFLKNLASVPNDTLQKRKERYLILDKFFPMIRRFDLNVQIIFAHHYHRQQLSLQNIVINFKQMGKHISQSTIQVGLSLEQNGNKFQEQKRYSEQQQVQQMVKYDKFSNFITLSIQCKQRNEKMKQFRENLKQTGQRMIDQITKTIQGYYN